MDSGGYAALFVRYYAGWVDKLEGEVVPVHGGDGFDYVVPEPYGVIGAIVPWNGPMMGMGQKAAPALAAGNTVVAKPPEIAPFGAIALRRARPRGRPPARASSTSCPAARSPARRWCATPASTRCRSPAAPRPPGW